MKKLFVGMLLMCACLFSAKADDDQAIDPAEALKDRLYTSIISAYNVKNWEEVNSLMEQLLAAGANIDELERTYAEALTGIGQPGKAIERLNDYIAKEPDDFLAYQLLGDAYQKQGDIAEARAAYDKCYEMRPDFARPLVSKARMLAATDTAAAMEAYNKAIRIFLVAERPDAAIQIGVEAYALDSQNVDMLMQVADALIRANMPDQAMSFFAGAIQANSQKENPDVAVSIEASYGISMIFYRQKEYQKALKMLSTMLEDKEIISSDKEAYGTALCLAAACETKLGRKKQADSYLKKGEKQIPESYMRTYNGFLEL